MLCFCVISKHSWSLVCATFVFLFFGGPLKDTMWGLLCVICVCFISCNTSNTIPNKNTCMRHPTKTNGLYFQKHVKNTLLWQVAKCRLYRVDGRFTPYNTRSCDVRYQFCSTCQEDDLVQSFTSLVEELQQRTCADDIGAAELRRKSYEFI